MGEGDVFEFFENFDVVSGKGRKSEVFDLVT